MEWIKIEKHPPTSGIYLCAGYLISHDLKVTDKKIIYLSQYFEKGNQWFADLGSYVHAYCTHWSELPEFPKEE